ncbi:MAG: hypothetical protein HDR29_04640 [Lachnospiraceae bacterium]|nr:hypothetical protein [Lachnospiraceae bacterium]
MSKRGKNFVSNLKKIFLLLLGACLLFLVIANLIPLNRKVSGEYTATLLSLSTQEQTGTAQIRFSGTYKQYLLNIVFHDRFEGAFYVEGNSLSERYGQNAFIDFGKGFSDKRGIVCYYNEEDDRLESLGMIVQRDQMQSGYLILREAMTQGQDDLILVFPENHSGALYRMHKEIGK